jgi:Tol biopolymer transport system component/DNA-binding winged helix-turn-helix (wHTH) protein
MSLAIKQFYRFGDFTVDAEQQVLLRQGIPVPVTPKVLHTLLILVENAGRIVKKEELMNQLWPDSFVEEANLSFNIQQLRKSLGDNARRPQYIETVARRGYRFIAKVESELNNGSYVDNHSTHPFPDRQGSALRSSKQIAVEPEKAFLARLFAVSPFRSIAMVVTLLAILGGAASILWKLSAASNRSLGEFVGTLPLKIEKLTATGQSQHAAISPDGKYLAYTHGFPNKQAIWLRQLATNTNIQILPAGGTIYGLTFAHSGEYLYFVKGNPAALYRVSLLGDVPIKIVDGSEGRFTLSNDDHHIAFVRTTRSDEGQLAYSLMIANSDGTAERTLLSREYPNKLDAPVWSPDRELIICAYGNSAAGGQSVGLVEVKVADGSMRELSAEKFANIVKIEWLPQQRGLIISAGKNSEGYLQLWRVSYPAMEFHQITAGLVSYSDLSFTANADKIVASQTTRSSNVCIGESRDPQNLKRITAATDKICWTPQGRLLYSSRVSGNEDLWMMQPDGSGQRQLTVDSRINASPAVATDNRYIVFMSNRTGVFQVWRMNTDGSNQVQLTSGSGKNFPAVSPDGKWVLYNTTDNWDLWKVAIDGGEPSRLIEHPAYFPSISPDGKMIACLGRNESKASLLILPFEGGQPLKTFDLGGQNFSGTRIQWTADRQALVYALEKDGVTKLVKQPLNGSRTEEIATFEDELFDFGYSPDGQTLAVTRGGWQHDVVLISDLNLR